MGDKCTPSRPAASTPTALSLRRRSPTASAPRDAFLRLLIPPTATATSSPRGDGFIATRRRWPSRCISCAACRWHSRRRFTTATAAARTIPCRATRPPSARLRALFRSTAASSGEKGICRLYVDATNITDSRYCDLGGTAARGVGHGGRGADHRPLIRSLPAAFRPVASRGGLFAGWPPPAVRSVSSGLSLLPAGWAAGETGAG